MKLSLLTFFIILCGQLSAQSVEDTLSIEVSPAAYDVQGNAYAVQGKVSYRFARYFELNSMYNLSINQKRFMKSEVVDQYKQNNYTYVGGSLIILNDGFKSKARPEKNPQKFGAYELKLDAGAFYSRHMTEKFYDYYAYDTLSNGGLKKISNISTLSLSTGFTFSYSQFKLYIRDVKNETKWLRRYSLSLGWLHGFDYYLNGFSYYPGTSEIATNINPPHTYDFRRDGYYARFDFQQRISEHLFAGIDLFFYKNPYVLYKYNHAIYEPRGEEAEPYYKIYGAVTIGYHF